MPTTTDDNFFQNVSSVIEQARKNARTAVNLAMVYAYFEIGKMIVEKEQHSANRAVYGTQLLKELADYLTKKFGKGYSPENLKLMRRFYVVYSEDQIGETVFTQFKNVQNPDKFGDLQIGQTVSGEFEKQIGETVFTQFKNLPTVSTGRKFYLSWSHYLKLMRISNIEERHFYEIESIKNDWSLRELERQFDSALYERLALSMDKDKVYRLALEGQKVEKPRDLVKDPYVLEFLGLPELATFSETELESRIIRSSTAISA